MDWDRVVAQVLPYLVRIETQDGGGSGFICLHNYDRSWVGIATAAHVVATAEDWQQPIKIFCVKTGQIKLLNAADRVIFMNWETDSAVVLIPNDFGFQQDTIPLLPATDVLPLGSSVGWLGYPAIARTTHCFFSGCVSAVESGHARSYLIDGVAINGVSGGPVFYYSTDQTATQIVGVLTAYRINRSRGEALPGLSVAQDVSHFHEVVKTVKNIDEARRQKEQLASQQAASQPPESSPLLTGKFPASPPA